MRRLRGIICCVIAAAVLCGCQAESSSDSSSDEEFSVVDIGGYSTSESEAETDIPQTSVTTSENTSEATSESTSDAESADTVPPAETTEKEVLNIPQDTSTEETTRDTTEAATPEATTEATTASTTVSTEAPQPSEQVDYNGYITLNHSEVRGVWISYLELATLLQGKTESEFRANIATALDNCENIGVNTVYIHARSHGDAYYKSELFPWSKYASGKINVSPYFDPLEIIIYEAHSRDISVQAWINPLRMASTSDMGSYGSYPAAEWLQNSKGKRIVEVGGYYYLNPAYDDVRKLISDGAAEIVANYDVDGLHIDDYFYPTTDASFDSSAFAESGYSVLSEFRFANCDKLVSGIYSAVKAANPNALFSVSCQGSIENNYNLMYADVEKWCVQSGYLDYIVPQIYYGFENSTQPYAECLSRWEDFASRGGIPLVVGLSVSKIGYEDKWAGAGKTEWLTDKDILARQLAEAMECISYGGACLYSYKSIFSAEAAVAAQVSAEIEAYTKQFQN